MHVKCIDFLHKRCLHLVHKTKKIAENIKIAPFKSVCINKCY